jgi:hypothetical protein
MERETPASTAPAPVVETVTAETPSTLWTTLTA